MNTLDKDIIITVSGFSVVTAGTYVYIVEKSNNTLSDYETIFAGNCWLDASQTSKQFYLNDILENCRSGFNNALGMTASYTRNISIYENIRVSILISNTYYRASKTVYFGYNYPNMKDYLIKDFYDREAMASNNVLVYNLLQGDLLPHIPYKDTSNFTLPFAFQYKYQISTPLYYVYTGGIIQPYEALTISGNLPKLNGLNLHSMFGSSSSYEEDSLLSIYSNQAVDTTEQNTWSTSTKTYGHSIRQLADDLFIVNDISNNNIVIATGNNNYYPIATSTLTTGVGTYTSQWVYVNFDDIEQRGDNTNIYLLFNISQMRPTNICVSNDNYYTGVKMVKVTFDYTLVNTIGEHTLTLRNMQIKVKNSEYIDVSQFSTIIPDGSVFESVAGTNYSYTIVKPTSSFEIWDNEEEIDIGIFNDIFSETPVHFETQPTEINFDDLDNKEIHINATNSHIGSGYISIICHNWFTGIKNIKVSFDYVYGEGEERNTGRMYNLKIEVQNFVFVKQFDIAHIDYCPAKYYLVWQDRYGGFQSQRFTGTETYSEGFEYTTMMNYKDEKTHRIVNVQPKWKIQTGWLNKTLYPYYESIFTSEDIMLYDTINDKSYICVVTDSSYTEKTYMNQSRKLFNLQLNIEQNKKQKMLN